MTTDEKKKAAGIGAILAALGLFLWFRRGKAKPATLTGIVRDATTSTALEGVLVKLNSLTYSTDITGLYYFADLSAGRHSLSVTQAGYKEAAMTIELQEGPNTVDINLVPIAVPEASVTFTVIDADTSAPIPGVTVTLEATPLITGSDGKCQFVGIIEGDYPITFVKEGYETIEDTVSFHL